MNNKRIISLFIVLLFVNLPLSTAFSFVTGRLNQIRDYAKTKLTQATVKEPAIGMAGK